MMRRFGLLILLFLSLLNVWAVTVQTQVSANQVTLNEPFVYAVIVAAEDAKDAPKVTPPEFPENLPFSILRKEQPRPSHNSQTTIINGKVTSSNQYTITLLYQLKPKFEGQHQIPALQLTVDGEKFQTEPITITVSKADASAGNSAKLTAKFSSEQAMLGYPVTLSYDFLLPVQFGARNLGAQLPTDFLAEHFTLANGQDWEQPQWRHGTRTINGMPCEAFHLELQLIPKHEGTITLPSAVMSYQVPDQQRSRRRRGGFPGGFFDDDFFDSDPFGMFGSYREVTVASDEITLEVQPLPAEGRPDDFTGIVGQLRVKAAVSSDEVTVGEPILLDLSLSGAPSLAEAKLPNLSALPELASHFKVSGDDPPLEKDGQVVFQRTLRATTPGEISIPAIPFSYFDPKAREYRTATTAPIPLKVTAARQITLADAQGNLPAAPAAIPQVPTELTASRTAGIEPNFPPEELQSRKLAPFISRKSFNLIILWLIIPPAAWFLCLLGTLVARHRNANSAQRATRGAKARLLRTANSLRDNDLQVATKFSAALQEFFTTRFLLPPGTVTFADAEAAALRDGFTSDQIAPFKAT